MLKVSILCDIDIFTQVTILTPKIIGTGRTAYLPTWFPGARLNYTEALLGARAYGDDGIAISATREGTETRHISWRRLYEMVNEAAKALRAAGVRVGDRIARTSAMPFSCHHHL